MYKKPLLSLLAVLFLTFAGTSVAASTPADPAVEPATPPVAELELADAPVCSDLSKGETVLAGDAAAPSADEPIDVLTIDTSWGYGICVPNFCQQCSSDYDCTGDNTCQFDVHCP